MVAPDGKIESAGCEVDEHGRITARVNIVQGGGTTEFRVWGNFSAYVEGLDRDRCCAELEAWACSVVATMLESGEEPGDYRMSEEDVRGILRRCR